MKMKIRKASVLLLICLITGCAIDDGLNYVPGPKSQYFSSCVKEFYGDNEERHILNCLVDHKTATFTYLYRLRYLIDRDTIRIYTSDTLSTYVIENYGYDNRDPDIEVLEIDKYKNLLINMHTKYLKTTDSIVVYKNIPCKKKMFDDMYDTFVNN